MHLGLGSSVFSLGEFSFTCLPKALIAAESCLNHSASSIAFINYFVSCLTFLLYFGRSWKAKIISHLSLCHPYGAKYLGCKKCPMHNKCVVSD